MTAATHANVLMLLANGFEPDPRVHKEAASLIEHGFTVTILCLDRQQDRAPEEEVDGIRVRRLRVGRVRAGHAGSLALALSRFYLRAAREARVLHAERPFDAVHCHDFDTVLLGLRLGRRLRLPVVYDLHDLYSAFLGDGVAARLVQRFDEQAYRAADAMILVNDRFYDLPGIDRGKSAVVMNVPPRAGGRRCEETGVGLFYAGNLDESRDMRYAMPVFRDAGLDAQFAGDGPLFEAHRAAAGSEAVTFLGRIPPGEVVDLTRDCLAVLALYETGNANNRLASPNKLFEAMKWGKPAIVSAGTVMGDIVEQRGCGAAVAYGDPESLRAALAELRDPERYRRMCDNAHRAFLEVYNWQVMEQRLIELYQRLLRSRRREDP